MRRAILVVAAASAALTLAACQKKTAEPTADAGTTSEAVNAAQDATAAAVGATAAATVGPMTTESFVTNAAISDMYEIQAGQIAQTKGQSAGVKDFGKMMVTDHTAMSNTMKPLVRAAGVTAPTGLDERRKGLIDNLNAAAPADFDKVYLNQQEAAHNEALTLHRGFADNAEHPELAAHAQAVVEPVSMHLDRAEALRETMG